MAFRHVQEIWACIQSSWVVRSKTPDILVKHNLILVQAEQLYVSDPRALHHIVVKVRLTSRPSLLALMLTLLTKDQSVYEETSMFTE